MPPCGEFDFLCLPKAAIGQLHCDIMRFEQRIHWQWFKSHAVLGVAFSFSRRGMVRKALMEHGY